MCISYLYLYWLISAAAPSFEQTHHTGFSRVQSVRLIWLFKSEIRLQDVVVSVYCLVAGLCWAAVQGSVPEELFCAAAGHLWFRLTTFLCCRKLGSFCSLPGSMQIKTTRKRSQSYFFGININIDITCTHVNINVFMNCIFIQCRFRSVCLIICLHTVPQQFRKEGPNGVMTLYFNPRLFART